MKLLFTYPEIQQIISDKLNQNIGLQSNGDNVLKIIKQSSLGNFATIDSSIEAEFTVYGEDLYIDYSVVPIENLKKDGLLSAFMNVVAKPNVVNVALSFFRNKYPQYNDTVEKVPNADRLRVHLAAIPQLQTVLQHVVIESITPNEDGVQINAHLKNK